MIATSLAAEKKNIQAEIMASKIPSSKNVVLDSETLVTNYGLVIAVDLKLELSNKLPEWTKNRKNDKIMIICGAHGKADGSLEGQAEPNSLRNLKVCFS